jgi:8-oxo-dGTP diphosphatase
MISDLTKFRVAVYGVLIEAGSVLLTNTRVPSGIITNFPGGGIELGEAPTEAVVREFREETTISVAIERLLFCSQACHRNPEYPHEQLIHIFYLVTRSSGEVLHTGNGDDVHSTIWAKPQELGGYPIQPVDLEFVHSSAFQDLWRVDSQSS